MVVVEWQGNSPLAANIIYYSACASTAPCVYVQAQYFLPKENCPGILLYLRPAEQN